MTKSKTIFGCIGLLLASSISIMAQRYEAETAALTGGAVKSACASCSGGEHVSQNEGNLNFNVSVAAESHFNIFLRVAAPHGNKINIFVVDDNSIDFSLTQPEYSTVKVVSGLKLSGGNHVLKINHSWGYINIDYIELEEVTGSGRYVINTTLVTPDPGDGAKRLYQFLYDNYGRKIVSGVMTLNSFDESSWLKTNTGKEPALIGLDFMHSGRGYAWYDDLDPIDDARTYYNRNGIPAICWHWRDPLRTTEEFYTANTTFDVSKIFIEGSAEYQAMLSDIDYIAGLLKILRDENIPVIWRPLHEAAGGWFWWGAKGAAPCKKLYQIMFDRMVNHHGLNNLIWVWTREPNDDEWYPGDEYVDIVSRDIYKDGDHSSQVLEWSDLNQRYDSKKMIALSESGSFPDVDNLVKDGAAWSWYMPWYGKYTRESQYNSLALWQKMFAHEYVLTLDEMPDLKTYVAVNPPPDTEPDPVLGADSPLRGFINVYPTRVDDRFFIESDAPVGKVALYNIMGQVVASENILTRGSISVSGFTSGLYYLKFKNHPAVKLIKN
jgi:mannan endo-1,4-beta-mannosidase